MTSQALGSAAGEYQQVNAAELHLMAARPGDSAETWQETKKTAEVLCCCCDDPDQVQNLLASFSLKFRHGTAAMYSVSASTFMAFNMETDWVNRTDVLPSHRP